MTAGAAHTVLFVALFLVSTSGPFLHLAAMDAWAVVVLRMAGASALLVPWAALSGGLRVPAGEGGRLVAGAVLLAAHFVLWVKAFDLTDYASNLLLLVAQPVMAAALGAALGERPTRAVVLSLVLAVAGLSTIARGDFALGPRALLGDAMCVLAGLCIALFYVVTRRARARMSMAAFLGLTLAIGTAVTLPAALVAGARFGPYPPASWGWLAALVVLTTVAGHGLMNVAARHVRLFTLNVVIVLEPAIGIALGAVLFGAQVTLVQLAGGAVLAVAVAVGLRPAAEGSASGQRPPSGTLRAT